MTGKERARRKRRKAITCVRLPEALVERLQALTDAARARGVVTNRTSAHIAALELGLPLLEERAREEQAP